MSDGHSAWWHDEQRWNRHGQTTGLTMTEYFTSDDPDLLMVHADMAAYMEAHPCTCDPDCACDDCGCGCSG